jgi:hypothetical protein
MSEWLLFNAISKIINFQWDDDDDQW